MVREHSRMNEIKKMREDEEEETKTKTSKKTLLIYYIYIFLLCMMHRSHDSFYAQSLCLAV